MAHQRFPTGINRARGLEAEILQSQDASFLIVVDNTNFVDLNNFKRRMKRGEQGQAPAAETQYPGSINLRNAFGAPSATLLCRGQRTFRRSRRSSGRRGSPRVCRHRGDGTAFLIPPAQLQAKGWDDEEHLRHHEAGLTQGDGSQARQPQFQ